jgi:hypothetical protein
MALPHSKALRAKQKTRVLKIFIHFATAAVQAEIGKLFARSALDCGGASHRFLARDLKRQMALPHSKALRAKRWRGAA